MLVPQSASYCSSHRPSEASLSFSLPSLTSPHHHSRPIDLSFTSPPSSRRLLLFCIISTPSVCWHYLSLLVLLLHRSLSLSTPASTTPTLYPTSRSSLAFPFQPAFFGPNRFHLSHCLPKDTPFLPIPLGRRRTALSIDF